MAFSCGARSAFKLDGKGYLRSMLSRRQLQGFVGLRLSIKAICRVIHNLIYDRLYSSLVRSGNLRVNCVRTDLHWRPCCLPSQVSTDHPDNYGEAAS